MDTARAKGAVQLNASAPRTLVALQRSAGNAAVASMLARRQAPAPSVDSPAASSGPEIVVDAPVEAERALPALGPAPGAQAQGDSPHDHDEPSPSDHPPELGDVIGAVGDAGVTPVDRPTNDDDADHATAPAPGAPAPVQRFGLSDLPGAGLVTRAANAVGDFAGAALDAAKRRIGSLTGSLSSGWNSLRSTAGNLLTGLGDAARGGVEEVGRLGSSISAGVSAGFGVATKTLSGLTSSFTRTMHRGLETVKGSAGALGHALSSMDAEGMRAAYASVKGSVGRVFGNLTAAASALNARSRVLWEGLTTRFTGAVRNLGTFASGVVDRVRTAAAGALARISGSWERLRGTAADIGGVGGVLARVATAVVDRLLSGLRSLWDGINSAWASVRNSLSAVSARVAAQVSAAREAVERQVKSSFDRLRASWTAATGRAAASTRSVLGGVAGMAGRIASFSLDKTITQVAAISKFVKWVSSAREEADAALQRRGAEIAGTIEARMPEGAREQVLQHAPGASPAPAGPGRAPVVQRQATGSGEARSSLSFGHALSSVWTASAHKWSKLSVKQLVIDLLKTMLWPWPAVGHEFVALGEDWKSSAHRLFTPRGSSIGTFFQDLWTDLLALLDFPLALVRHVVNMAGALMGWVTVILAGAGAVVFGALGSLLGPGGTAAGAIAGGAAGLAVAGAAGEAVLAAFVAAQATDLVRRLAELVSANLIAAERDEDVDKSSDSAIGLAVAGIIAGLVWIAGELAGSFLEAVRKLKAPPVKDPPPPSDPHPPVVDADTKPPDVTPKEQVPDQEPPDRQNPPPIDASAKVAERSDGSFRLNRKNIQNVDKIIGDPESRVYADANREAVAAELAAGKSGVEQVYLGEQADQLINGSLGQDLSADVVAVTKNSQYHVYEAKGSDITHGLEQLEHTSQQLGPGRVLRQTIVTKEKITTPGYTVKDSVLMLNGKQCLVDGKPVYIKFTTQRGGR
ncbi:hypothetical protein [Amycolatopsis sp. NPDC051102]|uniref:hypothetical protein n=1 Tax=Amycolatopsis sp. NPDC051102 TaxID=3155163 RepID=UPI00342747C0